MLIRLFDSKKRFICKKERDTLLKAVILPYLKNLNLSLGFNFKYNT